MQVSMATLGAATTRHCHTDDSVEILTYPYTYHIHQGGREVREQKAQHKHVSKLETTACTHAAGTLNMQPCKTPYIPYMATMRMTTPRTAAGQHWLDSNLA